MVALTDARVDAINKELPRLLKQIRDALDQVEQATSLELGHWHLATVNPPLASLALLFANARLPAFENRMKLHD